MAEFTDEQKRFVVRCFAKRMGSADVIEAFVDVYGAASRPPSNQIARYNPANKAGESLSADLLDLFRQERERADSDLSDIDGAHLTFRLRELTELFRSAKKMKNVVGAAGILEQIAKERGGMYKHRTQGASPDQVHDYIARQMAIVNQAVEKALLPSEGEGARVNEAIRTALDEAKSARAS